MKTLRQLFTPNKSHAMASSEPGHGRILLRQPEFEHFIEWNALREQSRSFLEPWEPIWGPNELVRASFRERVRKVQQAAENDQAYHFLVIRQEDSRLVGGINLSNVRRGVAQMGTIGYWIGEPFARQGYMTEALTALSAYAFGELALHRLEAACIPTNKASISLLQRCQFVAEGEAKAYLKIAGKWQDHLLFSRTAP